ncbi:MAG: hypothetical protein ABJF10_21295 [Chthoniobacter sp.]|uniref:hypothetical protein n=1 Tax=Chthoniobacter sp. TaxID=2510640 RepID=UPI0032A8798A
MPPASSTPEPLPVIATLVLLNGGSSSTKKLPGRKARYDFRLVQKAGIAGRPAHVREYTSLEVFHGEQADLAQSPARMQILVRLHEIDPANAAKSALGAFVRHLANPKEKMRAAQELVDLLQVEITRLEEVSKCGDPEPSDETSDGDQEGNGPRTPREERAMMLRRSPEEYVRHLLRDEYQIPDVQVLNNLDGMIEAVLNFEEERGDFEPKAEGEEGGTPTEPPAASGDSTPPQTPPEPGAPYTAEGLAQMPIDDLKAVAAKLGCRGGNRRTMAKNILEKQAQ